MTTPTFLSASQLHSLAGTEEPTDVFSASYDLVTKGLPAAIVSGVSELYNIIPTVSNKLGADMEMMDARSTIAMYDNDTAKYYDDHKLGVDTAGFILGSIVPGMTGIKILNKGQLFAREALAGNMGSWTARTLGLLAPDRDRYLLDAMTSIRSTGNVFSLTETNMMKSIVAGFTQNALEGAAFEIAVAATMNNSPILEAQDKGDLFWNVLTGAGVNGALGGIFSTASRSWKVAKAGREAEMELAPVTITRAVGKTADPHLKFVSAAEQLDEMKKFQAPTNDLKDRWNNMFETKQSALLNQMRAALLEMTSKQDGRLSGALFNRLQGESFENQVSLILDSHSVARVNSVTKAERLLSSAAKKIQETAAGKTPVLTKEEMAVLESNVKPGFLRIWGSGQDNILDSRPPILSIFDNAGPQDIKWSKTGIQIGGKFYPQEMNEFRSVNILGMSHKDYEARALWFERMPEWTEPKLIHYNDEPALMKAIRDKVEMVRVIPENGKLADAFELHGPEEMLNFKKRWVVDSYVKLAKMATDITRSAEIRADILKAATGIDFDIVVDPAATYRGFFAKIAGKVKSDAGLDMPVTGTTIAIEANALANSSVKQLLQTLKHEEGRSIFNALLSRASVTRDNIVARMPELVKEMLAISKQARPEGLGAYAQSERLHEIFADSFAWMAMHPEKLERFPAFNAFAGHLVRPVTPEVMKSLSVRSMKRTQEEIARMLNVTPEHLSGMEHDMSLDARSFYRKMYKETLLKKGVRESDIEADPLTLPSFAKIIYTPKSIKVNGNELQGLALFKAQMKLQKDDMNRVVAITTNSIIPGARYPDCPDQVLLQGNAGPTMLGAEAGGYGTPQSFFAQVGQLTNRLKLKAIADMNEMFSSHVSTMLKNKEAAIEFSLLNERLRNLPQRYALSDDGASFMLKGIKTPEDIEDAIARNFPLEIPIRNVETQELWKAHIERNKVYLAAKKYISSAQHVANKVDHDIVYPIPRDPKNTPFFAIVIDDSITGTGHSKMIYAESDAKLNVMKKAIEESSPQFTVLSKADSETYFKVRGKFEFESSLHDNYIQTELARKGTSASFMPMTDPKAIMEELIGWHTSRSASMVRMVASAKYEPQFNALMSAASDNMKLATSKMGHVGKMAYAENAVNNPASNLIKMALDIQKMEEYPVWSSAAKMLDSKFSILSQRISGLWQNATSPENLSEINTIFQKYGIGGPFPVEITPALYEAMNGKIPRGKLTTLVGQVNGFISTFALRLDPFNAINNIIGAQVLYGAEVRALLSAIKAGDADAAGELHKLAYLKVPGTEDFILSPGKLFANSISRFKDKSLREFYRQHGFITSLSDQYHSVIDDVAAQLASDGNISKAMAKMKAMASTGEALTGNKLAEEFNRFIAADTMRQITDLAVSKGVIEADEAFAYINTFVNRTQGNFLASQRPLLFQGPIGQAIGLFQTYQFNLIQQLLRHVGEGQAKSAAIMAGLQASIYGMNGLPAFNAINTHIIGTASGNKNHTDAVDAVYSMTGKELGDWVMYGFGSNVLGLLHPDLKNNMYSRGDVNPRNFTIVPVDPTEVPMVKASVRFLQNIKTMFSQTAQGAPMWETFLRGVEHNGISRPLSGLAQVLEGAISQRGSVAPVNTHENITMAHDLVSLASGMRMLGAKPLDESIVNDMMFRFQAYDRSDKIARGTLGEAIKLRILGGGDIDRAEIEEFTKRYVQTGGRQENFVKFMAAQHRNANESQANQLHGILSEKKMQTYQRLMGGYSLDDLTFDPNKLR